MNKRFLPLICLLIVFGACKDDKQDPKVEGDLTDVLYAPVPYVPEIPASFPPLEVPEDNPLTEEGVQLGRRLFYDPILSADQTVSCASCHPIFSSFADPTRFSFGVNGTQGNRQGMALINAGFYQNGLFWDGRVMTLEEQALLPVEDPLELHEDWDNVVEKIKNHPDYPERFRKAFGIENVNDITKELAVKAIAQFERIIISGGNSKYDQVLRNEAFFTEEELNGFDMFFDISADIPDAECGHCHNGPLLSTNEYFNNGLDNITDLENFPDKGRGLVTQRLFDNGKFRAPTLRNIQMTPPYMHDGRFSTLEEVIEHYNSGGHYAPNLDPLIRPLGLTEQEKSDLVAFLKTLTDTNFLNNPDLSNPF